MLSLRNGALQKKTRENKMKKNIYLKKCWKNQLYFTRPIKEAWAKLDLNFEKIDTITGNISKIKKVEIEKKKYKKRSKNLI